MNIKSLMLTPEEVRAIDYKQDVYREICDQCTEEHLKAQLQKLQSEADRTGKVIAFVPKGFEWKLPEYDFTDSPTFFESGYNIAQQDLLNEINKVFERVEEK